MQNEVLKIFKKYFEIPRGFYNDAYLFYFQNWLKKPMETA